MFEIRVTEDVDLIIEITSYYERAALEKNLRSMGFTHDMESKVICRFKIEGIIVDIMPSADRSVGFRNKWYPEGFKQAVDYRIDNNNTIKILSAPYFLATKLEAFKGRGRGDGRMSHDFEDIVFVLENRKQVWEELKNLEGKIGEYLRSEFLILLNNANIKEWIGAHVERGSPPATSYILEELKKCFL